MHTPALNFDPALLLKAQGVRVAFFDVDGVLTDSNGVAVDTTCSEFIWCAIGIPGIVPFIGTVLTAPVRAFSAVKWTVIDWAEHIEPGLVNTLVERAARRLDELARGSGDPDPDPEGN
jgi:hypothetical protein